MIKLVFVESHLGGVPVDKYREALEERLRKEYPSEEFEVSSKQDGPCTEIHGCDNLGQIADIQDLEEVVFDKLRTAPATMAKPAYCTRFDVPSCQECSLVNYGRDCMNFPVIPEPRRAGDAG